MLLLNSLNFSLKNISWQFLFKTEHHCNTAKARIARTWKSRAKIENQATKRVYTNWAKLKEIAIVATYTQYCISYCPVNLFNLLFSFKSTIRFFKLFVKSIRFQPIIKCLFKSINFLIKSLLRVF